MKSFIIALFIGVVTSFAYASTWAVEGTEIEWTPHLWAMFNDAERCTADGGYHDVSAVYQHVSDQFGVTVFAVYEDGTILAMKDMIAERFSLDYCE